MSKRLWTFHGLADATRADSVQTSTAYPMPTRPFCMASKRLDTTARSGSKRRAAPRAQCRSALPNRRSTRAAPAM